MAGGEGDGVGPDSQGITVGSQRFEAPRGGLRAVRGRMETTVALVHDGALLDVRPVLGDALQEHGRSVGIIVAQDRFPWTALLAAPLHLGKGPQIARYR